jgi:hypothetical protein
VTAIERWKEATGLDEAAMMGVAVEAWLDAADRVCCKR